MEPWIYIIILYTFAKLNVLLYSLIFLIFIIGFWLIPTCFHPYCPFPVFRYFLYCFHLCLYHFWKNGFGNGWDVFRLFSSLSAHYNDLYKFGCVHPLMDVEAKFLNPLSKKKRYLYLDFRFCYLQLISHLSDNMATLKNWLEKLAISKRVQFAGRGENQRLKWIPVHIQLLQINTCLEEHRLK